MGTYIAFVTARGPDCLAPFVSDMFTRPVDDRQTETSWEV